MIFGLGLGRIIDLPGLLEVVTKLHGLIGIQPAQHFVHHGIQAALHPDMCSPNAGYCRLKHHIPRNRHRHSGHSNRPAPLPSGMDPAGRIPLDLRCGDAPVD